MWQTNFNIIFFFCLLQIFVFSCFFILYATDDSTWVYSHFIVMFAIYTYIMATENKSFPENMSTILCFFSVYF